jgi:hypothetical protein
VACTWRQPPCTRRRANDLSAGEQRKPEASADAIPRGPRIATCHQNGLRFDLWKSSQFYPRIPSAPPSVG